ncbi:MAG TPA: alkaline phosphatase family protein [Thermoleophilaceae bacterium]|jgi:acid phosphatase|nr:alkaline phosphatase family protein [Thermoleophilaceae bacterium]
MNLFRRALAVALLVAVVASLSAEGSGRAVSVPRLQRVAVLVLENRSYEQVIGRPAAPFLNRLARRYALASNYFAIGHRSLPNYIALTGGDTNGINDNCTTCDTEQPNLLNQLDTAHVSWRAYFEGLRPGSRLTAPTARYNPHYDPFAYYERVEHNSRARHRIVDFGALRHDLGRGRLPRFSWIAPDVLHDGHNGTLRSADRFAARLVPRILRALGPHGVLYITWDEGPNSDLRGAAGVPGGGHVPLIAAGGAARRHTQDTGPANHYALLRTIETQFRVPLLRNAALDSTMLLTGLVRGS